MPSWLRLLSALVVSLFVSLGSSTSAWAGEPSLVAGNPADSKVDAHGPSLVVPHDVPVILPTAHAAIPPVPSSYVTRDMGWLELSYPASASERVATLIQDADAIKAELSRVLGQPVLSHVTVRVAPTVADMARLSPVDAPPPAYASGVAYHGLHLVLLSMLQPHGAEAVDLDEVFRHELAHVALEDAVQGKHVPVWFNEGLAISLSGEPSMLRMKTLWNATLSDTLLPLSDLDRSFPRENAEVSIAYAESADFMRFLTRKADQIRFAAVVDRIREGQQFDRAMTEAYGGDLRRLEFEWRGDLERRFSVLPILAGGGLVWGLLMVVLVAAYVRRRRRTKAILARWEREEAIEDARLAARLAAERGNPLVPMTHIVSAATAGPVKVSVKVERNGGWHTLH